MEQQPSTENSIVIIKTYPDLARELAKMMSFAKREVFLAPRYYEPAITSKLLSKFVEGVSIHMLDAKACGLALEDRLRAASSHDEKNRELILRFLGAPETLIKVEKLDYSFVVVDGHACGIELVNPVSPDNFYCAIRVESVPLAKELIGIFNDLANSRIRNRSTVETPKPIATIQSSGRQ